MNTDKNQTKCSQRVQRRIKGMFSRKFKKKWSMENTDLDRFHIPEL